MESMGLWEDTDHDVTPLVDFDWQVSVGLDPFSKGGVHHCSKTKDHRFIWNSRTANKKSVFMY